MHIVEKIFGPRTHEAEAQVGSRPSRPTELVIVRVFNGQGILFLSHDNFFSWLEMSSISAADMTSQLLGIRTISHTTYST